MSSWAARAPCVHQQAGPQRRRARQVIERSTRSVIWPSGWATCAPSAGEPHDAHPRHLFLPDRVWVTLDEPLDRAGDPSRWLAYAYSDDSVITQLHEERSSPSMATRSAAPARCLPWCSPCSVTLTRNPGTDPGDRHRHRVDRCPAGHQLGDDRVVSVEVDPVVADTARRNLTRAGRGPLVVTGDGAQGYPPGAPYDRVIATCSVQTVPYSWVAQTRPSGVILTPLGLDLREQRVVASDRRHHRRPRPHRRRPR